MYERIDCNTSLIISSLPAFDNARPLHVFIRLNMRSLIKEKTDFLSLPITEGNPKYIFVTHIVVYSIKKLILKEVVKNSSLPCLNISVVLYLNFFF
jgi:hypothetical protein